MATLFHVELVTPERILFSGQGDEVTLRAEGGEIAFLANHEDYIGALDITALQIHAPQADADTHGIEADELNAAVHGGFVKVDRDGVTILAGVAELADEIDVARAERALASAESRQSEEPVASDQGSTEEIEHARARSGAMLALLEPDSPTAALRRAQVRLEVVGASPSTHS